MILEDLKKLSEINLIHFESHSIKVSNIIDIIVFLLIILVIKILLKRFIVKTKHIDYANKFSLIQLTKYCLTIFSTIVCIKLIGFDISVILAGSAALLVGLGLGLQKLFNDFISGIILLLDKTIKVNDIIEINGNIYKVLEINFRTTNALGRDENTVILPNSDITGNKVINWTHSKISSRFKVQLGVDYGTDVQLLIKILKKIAISNPGVLNHPEPFVRFEDFADSSLLFSIYFFTDEVFLVEEIKSKIRTDLYEELKLNKINIPFPQRVVTIKPN